MVHSIYTGPMVTKLPRIAILGTGNMGGAILQGLTGPGVSSEGIRVTTRSESSASKLRAAGVAADSLELAPSANSEAVRDADIIVLAVKPAQIVGLIAEIASAAKPEAILVSVAAGITLSTMEEAWPGALVRTMPNTPAQVGLGVTGIAPGSRVSEDELALVRSMCETFGDVIEVQESEINALSSFSGSGPAYVYFLMERFMEVAMERGFSDEAARVMVEGTFRGAAELLARSGESPQTLREAVTSPAGTTAAALGVFGDADLAGIIRAATDAAIARAEEMAKD
jgi:pyrroline-5-carboxylate reductase